MGLEERGKANYYYFKRREGARVRSIYGGSGALARWTAGIEAERRTERRAEIEHLRAERENARELWQGFLAADADLWKRIQALAAEAGIHRPQRGKWRRKRHE